jgi:hypothetical protein
VSGGTFFSPPKTGEGEEVAKRVVCRVVRSVPLSRPGEQGLPYRIDPHRAGWGIDKSKYEIVSSAISGLAMTEVAFHPRRVSPPESWWRANVYLQQYQVTAGLFIDTLA